MCANRIAHGYFDINLDVVWVTVQTALLQLLERLPTLYGGFAARQSATNKDAIHDFRSNICKWGFLRSIVLNVACVMAVYFAKPPYLDLFLPALFRAFQNFILSSLSL
ncbi:MAG: HepT-like ribonuclease domain-containing protein [Methylobacter sp.]